MVKKAVYCMQYLNIKDIDIEELEVYKSLRDSAFSSDNSFIADSPKVVNILLNSNVKIKSILATKEYYDEFQMLLKEKNIEKRYMTTKEEMGKIVGHKIHHNCMMHGIRPANVSLCEMDDKIIMLDKITSSENVGSIVRSCAALGIKSLVIAKETPHPFNRRALRVAMGHSIMLKTYIHDDIKLSIKAMQELGYKVYAAEVCENSTPLKNVKIVQKWVLIMGHEGEGISKDILELCDEVVSIEMQDGIKSFNVGVAASIMMYQFLNVLK